ncbi:TRAP transporter large permease subunit [Photobacterium sp.]|uniref:TRAP transporter large permease n=1 Tax=Photobacterium sp. TaxID=660 RepID=UPI00299E30BD|nr:TRAP transporter large permease subunit [Photobacterium sp.]MDX1301449.1 TRAP transporter large permease subunit [Photobacterium sp.]
MIILLVCMLLALIIIGMPIYGAILFSSLVYIFIRGDIYPELIAQQLYSGIDKYSLLAIPLYIFAGNIISSSCIGEKIVLFMKKIFGHLHGGMAISTVLSSMFFSLISGSAPATVLTVGRLSTKSMLDSGYSKKFTLGLIVSTGSLGIVIPPSIFLIVYGVVTGSSVQDLFKYGAIGGFIFGSLFMLGTAIYARINGYPRKKLASFRELVNQFIDSAPSLLLPTIVIVGISTGITSPTEAGVIIIAYGIFLGSLIYRDLSLKSIFQIAVQSALTCSQIMIIMAAASLLGWLIAESNVLNVIYSLFSGFDNLFIPLLLLNIIFLVLGMLIDVTSLAVILSGIIVAISKSLDVSLVAIGVIMAVTGAIGMFTPPFGLSLFVAKDIGGESYTDTVNALKPFYLMSCFALLVVNIVILALV